MEEMTLEPEVVLVEDDPHVSRLISRSLVRKGFVVSVLSSLGEARQRLAAEWDVLILDRHLPDGDGLEFVAEIRKRVPYGYILMLTGDATHESRLRGFEEGADDFVAKPFELEELAARVRAGARIVHLQKALLETNRRLEHLTLTDPLTAVWNRRAFDAELGKAFVHAVRYERPLGLLMIDVDRFKAVNDTFGHHTGDEVLRGVARLVSAATRQSDFVARVGGEELAVILPESGLFEGIQAAEKIRQLIEVSQLGLQSAGQTTVSVGVASIPHSQLASAAELIEAADQALYRAKSAGRNRVGVERRRYGKGSASVEVERRRDSGAWSGQIFSSAS